MNRQSLAAITNGMGEDALREGLQLAELENSNLRRILLWCAERLPNSEVPKLAKMIREPLMQGGITETGAEDDMRRNRNFCHAAGAAADMLEQYLEGDCDDGVTGTWRQKATKAISFIRENLPKKFTPSLAFLREVTGTQ